MLPEFSALLRDVYPTLEDSDRIQERSQLPQPGMEHAMWWWDVREGKEGGECLDSDTRSLRNDSEVEAVTALVAHLLRSGNRPKAITVLASYSAQVDCIQDSLDCLPTVQHSGGWPVADVHGIAARSLLNNLEGGPADGATAAQCLEVCETFFKLADLDGASKALGLAAKRLAASDELAAVRAAQGRVEKLALFKKGLQVGNKQLLDQIKQLEALLTQWRSAGDVSAAAAGCIVLCEELAKLQGARAGEHSQRACPTQATCQRKHPPIHPQGRRSSRGCRKGSS